ncbi:MAG: hypothetical protein JWP75_2165 [Frondihabitans sp.]|jgi:hypothetical protein|nr:hypothetical protein [Frondihabitans sp.]
MTRRFAIGISAAVLTVGLLAGCTSTGSQTEPDTNRSTSTPVAAVAQVSSVSPTAGGLVGGETATITGTDLTGVTKVTFNGTVAQNLTVVSATKITVVVPQAVNYQPSSGAIAVYKGTAPVTTTSSPTFTWSVKTPVDKEMEYAFSHWSAATYNTAYENFNSVGGDCQNFVSQSLEAAGLPQTSSWFYTSAGSHSETWGYAPSFNSLLESTPPLGFTKLTDAQRSQLQVGDLAYFDWNNNGVPDHTMIVSGVTTVDGKTKVTLVGHNLDFDYRDLDTTITHDHPGATVWFWKLPASLR